MPYSADEFLVRQSTLDGESFKYRVYVPPSRDINDLLPVMLYLHGSGNRGSDNESQLNGLAAEIRSAPQNFSFIVVIPQCEADGFWDEKALNRANRALDDTVASLHGDSDRLYLAGFSLGGYGVWSMAATFPEKFAAIVPMSGRVLPRKGELKNVSPEIARLSEEPDPYKAFAEKIRNVPVWIFHGAEDRVVPLENSRRMSSALKEAGDGNVRYTEVAGAGHESLGFRNPELFIWLSEQKR